MRQMDACVLAAVPAASHALIVFMDSSNGSSSTPIKKGPSASAARVTASCTACSFSVASFSKTSHVTRSAASLCPVLSCPRRASAAWIRSSHFSISVKTKPVALSFFCATNLEQFVIWSPARLTANSACCRDSLVKPLPLRRLLASSARSHSSSDGVSISRISSTTLFAAWRCMKSWRTVFNGLSLFCASCSCCCSFASSVAAMVRTLSLSKRFTAACLAFK
mmetsp:Transcript_49093/g.131380  ORF Transcript_49093/g.131380 Transcript_49093/m.131380 type:complete len:222 (+) Transcript_49093:3084-3749(+)